MCKSRGWILLAVMLTAPMVAASANVITDWDEKAVGVVQTRMTPPAAYRVMAILHVAMFDAVNSIEPRYKPYKTAIAAPPEASKEVAAATAAGAVLAKLVPDAAGETQAALQSYLATIPDGEAKASGVKVGEEVAARILESRANDGASAPYTYRPRTRPGAYVPTAITVGSQYVNVTPFTMTSPSQFRPKAPIALTSRQWAKDYNEIKELGEKNSTKRTARQTEDARFWLLTGPLATHPLERQIAMRKEMSVVDTARFLALLSAAEEDAIIAVMDAKYAYEFWRPLTAIRNGDIDGNAATERQADWLPIDNTPLHPEYPCAHCIVSSAVASTIRAVLGTDEIPEVTLTSSFAPGVMHRFTDLTAYTNEVAMARIFAGFHYRFSIVVGQEMGRKIGAQAVAKVMQPAQRVSAR